MRPGESAADYRSLSMFGLPTPVSIADSTIVELAQPSQQQAQVCAAGDMEYPLLHLVPQAEACSGGSGGADLDVVETG
jgi:hypothetical protein